MAVSAAKVLRDYRQLFKELGLPEGKALIRIPEEAASVHAPIEPVEPKSLGRVIINDQTDRELFGRGGLMDIDLTSARIWGGALVPDGDYVATEDALRRAKLPGGGVIIQDREYALLEFEAGFQVKGIVMQWSLKLQATRGIR